MADAALVHQHFHHLFVVVDLPLELLVLGVEPCVYLLLLDKGSFQVLELLLQIVRILSVVHLTH